VFPPQKKIDFVSQNGYFNASWALFRTVPLHVFQIRSSALGLKNRCHACMQRANDARAAEAKQICNSMKTGLFEG